MGYSLSSRLIILIVLLGACGLIVHLKPFKASPSFFKASKDLGNHLSSFPNWRKNKSIELSSTVEEVLKLDDYINAEYTNKTGDVFLYIGQYHSSQKVGAAHDPLVCFPGQGWKVSQRETGEIEISINSQNHIISYSAMIAEIGDKRQLLLYWFQAYDKAFASTLPQKLYSFYNTLLNHGQGNAFVRLSTSFENESIKEAKNLLISFTRDFYPVYLHYVTELKKS